MHPTAYKFRLYDKNQDFFTSIASKIIALNQHWLDNGEKIFSPVLRSSIFDLKTDKSDPSFLSTSEKIANHQTYTKFLQHTKPQNYIYKLQIHFTIHNNKIIHHRPRSHKRIPS